MHNHLVEFYESDALLVESVGDFLTPALEQGEAVIVVATEAHRVSFADALAERGVELEAARQQGRLVELDAGETLGRFVVESVPDENMFDAVVGRLVRRTGARSPNLRVYGEMVAVMWDRGNAAGALQLEQLWNRLSEEQPFTLMCAYPLATVEVGSGGFRGICVTHSNVRLRFSAPPPRPEPAGADSRDGMAGLQGLGSELSALKEVIRNASQMGRLAGSRKTVTASPTGGLDCEISPHHPA